MLYALNESEDLSDAMLDAINEIRTSNLVNYIAYDTLKKSYCVKPMKKTSKKKKSVIEKTSVKFYPGLTKKIERRWRPLLSSDYVDTHKHPSSIAKGTLIHKEIHEYLKNPTMEMSKMDDMTRSILKALKESNRTILASEVPCRSTAGNFITQADMIVMNENDEIELVEIKTGKLSHETKNKEDTKYFKFPLNEIEYNKLSEAKLQLAYTGLAIEETIPNLTIDKHLIINVYTYTDSDDKKDKVETVFISSFEWPTVMKNTSKMEKKVLLGYLEE